MTTVECHYCSGTGTTVDANGSRTRCFACKGRGLLVAADVTKEGR